MYSADFGMEQYTMKKKTAIVTGGTANDVPAMACLVMNIKDTNPNLADEIVILHDGISEKDQRLINSIFPTRFIFYESPFKTVKEFGSVVTNYFSLMVFCKYECFKLLEDYEKVIWTDYDVVIIENLLHLTQNNCQAIFSYTPDPLFKQFTATAYQIVDPVKYNLNSEAIGLPLFILSDKLNNYKNYYYWLLDATIKYAQVLYLPETAIINLLLQEFNIPFENTIGIDYYAHPIHDAQIQNKKILHAYGQPKFWNGLYNETWEKNYTQWIKMGGSPYEHRTMKYKLKTIKQNFKSTVKKAIKKLIRKI